MRRYTRTIKFTKGDEILLEELYFIRGISNDAIKDSYKELGDDIVEITENITIKLVIDFDNKLTNLFEAYNGNFVRDMVIEYTGMNGDYSIDLDINKDTAKVDIVSG